jgi:metal iron transporter
MSSSASTSAPLNLEDGEDGDEIVDYSNNKLTIVIGAVIWLIVVGANVYALVDLGLGAAKS